MATVARSSVMAGLAITLAVTALSCGTCPPLPSITSISPVTATAGGSQFLLAVSGNDFRHDSVVNWNGTYVVTTFVSTHQLFATITAADTAQPGAVLVSVFNPPEGSITSVSGAIGALPTSACSGKNSNAVSFTVNPRFVWVGSYFDPLAAPRQMHFALLAFGGYSESNSFRL